MLLIPLLVCPFSTLKESKLGNHIYKPLFCLSVFFSGRLQWQKIRAIQIFTEHILLNHANMVVYARQLDLVSVCTLK